MTKHRRCMKTLNCLLSALCLSLMWLLWQPRALTDGSATDPDHGRSYRGSHRHQTIYDNVMLPVINTSHFIQYLTLTDAQLLFHRYVINRQVACHSLRRVGDINEGGYEICTMKPYAPSVGKCIVYSFGIGENWSFDDGMHEIYKCEVHSFDPSINLTDHQRSERHYFHSVGIWGQGRMTSEGWTLQTLGTIREYLGHSEREIDILKLDIEGSEWTTLRNIIAEAHTKFIKQIIIEIHAPRPRWSRDKVTKRDFDEMFQILFDLRRHGFELYLQHADKFCCGRFGDLVPQSVANKLICCYELFFININYYEKPKE